MLREIITLLRTGDIRAVFVDIAVLVFVLFCTMPIHEYAHALIATKQGDDTARLSGRLTINPMAHISPIGALMMVVVGFGYAKPVPVNIHNLKHGKKSFALVALAGPVSNLIMAFIFLLMNAVVMTFYSKGIANNAITSVLSTFFYAAASINVSLAVFNLIPIPPLDGSRILTLLVPDKYYYLLLQYERYIMIGLFVLIWIGVLSVPLAFLAKWTMFGINWLAQLPFKLLGAF